MTMLRTMGVIALTAFLLAPLASAECDAGGQPIPSSGTSGTTTAMLSVSGVTSIDDVTVDVALQHTFMGDLEIFLTSPMGTQVMLFDQRCGSQDNMDVTFDDAASIPVASACPVTGGQVVQPEQPLSAFDGEDATGNWTLRIDDLFGGDSGVLGQWCVNVSGAGGGGDPAVVPASSPISLAITALVMLAGLSLVLLRK